MKFAKELKEDLLRDGYPDYWVQSAIPYGQLKKILKELRGEFDRIGLTPQILNELAHPSASENIQQQRPGGGSTPAAARYQFADIEKGAEPKLIFYIENGVAIDASFSPEARQFLLDLTTRYRQCPSLPEEHDLEAKHSSPGCLQTVTFSRHLGLPEDTSPPLVVETDRVIKRLDISLKFDAQFFRAIQGDVSTLDTLQAGEHAAMSEEIRELGLEVAKLASPSRSQKTDLERWRELFDLYLQASVFFSTNELDGGSRNSSVALKQLQWFQSQIQSRGIAKSFKLPASRQALEKFTQINLTLLLNLKYHELNQRALRKILKKFDKRTALGVKNAFPKLIRSDIIMSETIAKSVCAEVSSEIVKIVPQLDDYLCPVCFSISYKPVRLNCGHVFCIRCMVQMQKQSAKFCPLCRDDVVMNADSANLDKALMSFLKRYFPKETKAKQKENEIAAGVDLYGADYANSKCIVM